MKALILNKKVVDISENEFPVTKDFSWVECDKTIKCGFNYIDNVFSNPNPIDLEEETKLNRTEELKINLSKTDYMMLIDYQERTSKTAEELEQVKQERLAWYTELKSLQM